MGAQIARRYLITGMVQGVGYRAFAERCAREIGVTGWARNRDDGGVEVHANGTVERLADFEARLRQGPRWAQVRGVEAVSACMDAPAGNYSIDNNLFYDNKPAREDFKVSTQFAAGIMH